MLVGCLVGLAKGGLRGVRLGRRRERFNRYGFTGSLEIPPDTGGLRVDWSFRLPHYFLFIGETAMPCRGVRGATTVDQNDREEILTATRQLLALLIRHNEMEATDIASAIFTTTPDIDAEFPALAARQLGWLEVPLICSHEMTVPGSLPLCIRV